MDPRYTDIWYINPEGRYLDKALHDVQRMILASEGFAWFDEFADRAAVFVMLKTMVSEHPSPINHYLTGYAAMAVNRAGPARAHLQAVVDSGCFEHIRTRIDAELEVIAIEGALGPGWPLGLPWPEEPSLGRSPPMRCSRIVIRTTGSTSVLR